MFHHCSIVPTAWISSNVEGPMHSNLGNFITTYMLKVAIYFGVLFNLCADGVRRMQKTYNFNNLMRSVTSHDKGLRHSKIYPSL